MDRVNQDMNQLQNATRETFKKTSPISAVYRTAVARLIVKIRLACSLPAFDTQELAAAVEAWCEVLTERVPVDRLNDCYLFAIRNRESTFPLAVTEIITAWKAIAVEEAEQAKRKPHCYVCKGAGIQLIYNPKTDTETLKQCPYCLGDVPTDLVLSNTTR